MTLLLIVVGIVGFLVWAVGGFVYRQLDNIGGAITINKSHPGFWRWVLRPLLWLAYAIVAVVVLAALGINNIWMLGTIALTAAVALAHHRWVKLIGDHPLTKDGLRHAIEERVLVQALEKAFVTTKLGQQVGGSKEIALPTIEAMTQLTTAARTPFGVEIEVEASLGGGSISDIADLIGETRMDDRLTSEINKHLKTMSTGLISLARHMDGVPTYREALILDNFEGDSGLGKLQILRDDPLRYTHLYSERYPVGIQRAMGWKLTHGSYAGLNRQGIEQRQSLRYCTLLQGAPGSGKSLAMDCAIATAIECTDPTVNIIIDMKAGAHMWPWRAGVNGFIYTPEAVDRFFQGLYLEMFRRLVKLQEQGTTGLLIESTHEMPWINVFFDECQLASQSVVGDGGYWEMIIRLGRAVGIQIFSATQYATASSGLSRAGIVAIPSRMSARVTDTTAAIVATGGVRDKISPDRIPDSDWYKGVLILNDDDGRKAMVKGPFMSEEEKVRRAEYNRTFMFPTPEWIREICDNQSWEDALARWEKEFDRPVRKPTAAEVAEELAVAPVITITEEDDERDDVDVAFVKSEGKRLCKLVGSTPSKAMKSHKSWMVVKRELGKHFHPARNQEDMTDAEKEEYWLALEQSWKLVASAIREKLI